MVKKAKKSDGGRHVAPRAPVQLPAALVAELRDWCAAHGKVLTHEITHMIEKFLRSKRGKH